MTKSTSAVARGQRGQARLRQLAIENEAEREAEAARLTAGLGHPPTAIELVVIEQLAARTVAGRRLRRQGKDDTEQSRLIAQLLRSIGLKPDVPQQEPGHDLQEYLREKYGSPAPTSEATP
jgi:hypothetical protein